MTGGRAESAPPGDESPAVGPPPVNPADRLLAQRLRAGDPAAQQQVWDQYGTLVRRLLARGLGPRHDVEDAVQEVFLNLFRDLKSLRQDDKLRSFIVAVTVNVLKMELRRARVRRLVGLTSSGVVPEPDVREHDPLAGVALRRVYELLQGFSAVERTAFVLRQFEGFELLEIAAVLRISLATVKRKVSRTSTRLAELMRKDAVLSQYLEDAAEDERGGEGKDTREGKA